MALSCVYAGHYLSARAVRTDDGRFQARVAIALFPSGEASPPHAIDFELFASEWDANLRAIEGGKAWVDAQRSKTAPTRGIPSPGPLQDD